MAMTHLLLHSTQQTFHLRSFPTKCHHNNNNIITLKKNYYYYNHSPCFIKTSSKFNNIKCFSMNHKPQYEKGNSLVATETNMHGMISRSMQNVMKAFQVFMIAGVISGLLFMYDHEHGRIALAASGGRMGGRSFSSSSRSSRPSYSSSESYSTLVGSPAPINTAEAKPNGVEVFMGFFVFVFVVFLIIIGLLHIENAAKSSVLKLQVGSLNTGRSLQRELNRIAESADTSTSGGLNYVLQETILALLRHSDHCISGYSSVDVKKSLSECEKIFDQLSIEERGKFDEETLVNVNNIKKKSATTQSSNGLPNEYIVVTIITAARGVSELPPIKNSEQLKKALQLLASIPSSSIMGAEVLWTPQKEDDSLTKQDLVADYPLLHPL